MKHPHRKLSWAAWLDIILVALTIIVIIIAIAKVAGHIELRAETTKPVLDEGAVLSAPKSQVMHPLLHIDEPIIEKLFIEEEVEPGYCNPNYKREIIFVEHQIIEISEEFLLQYEQEQEEERMLGCATEEYLFELNSTERRMLAALVTLEVGSESYECQKAVASVVINRMITGNKTLNDVIYADNQFSVASKVDYWEPKESCINAVEEVLRYGTTVPRYVTFFRADHYHDWGDRYVSYKKIDRTYFSYDTKLKEKWA